MLPTGGQSFLLFPVVITPAVWLCLLPSEWCSSDTEEVGHISSTWQRSTLVPLYPNPSVKHSLMGYKSMRKALEAPKRIIHISDTVVNATLLAPQSQNKPTVASVLFCPSNRTPLFTSCCKRGSLEPFCPFLSMVFPPFPPNPFHRSEYLRDVKNKRRDPLFYQ